MINGQTTAPGILTFPIYGGNNANGLQPVFDLVQTFLYLSHESKNSLHCSLANGFHLLFSSANLSLSCLGNQLSRDFLRPPGILHQMAFYCKITSCRKIGGRYQFSVTPGPVLYFSAGARHKRSNIGRRILD